MKRIGIDARFFTSRATGVGVHVYELVQELSRIDDQNLYTIFLNPEECKRFKLPGLNFEKEETTCRHYSWQEQTKFLFQINKHKFDLMIFPTFNAPVLYNRPFIVTVHDLTLHFFPGKKKKDLISRLAYKFVINTVTRKARHCFAVSKNTKKDMMEILGLPSEKITVSYNGVKPRFAPIDDKNMLDRFREQYSLPKKYFLYTGVKRSHKNIVGLIKAYDLFQRKYPALGMELVLAGPFDNVYTEVKDIISELGLKDKVQLQGLFPEGDLVKLICASSAYVFPSFYEGFGIPPVEAMQCGVPVACSNTSSLPEAAGNAAEYFDPYSVNDMLHAMETVIFNKERRADLIEKGFLQSSAFRWEDMAKTMFVEYKKVLDEK